MSNKPSMGSANSLSSKPVENSRPGVGSNRLAAAAAVAAFLLSNGVLGMAVVYRGASVYAWLSAAPTWAFYLLLIGFTALGIQVELLLVALGVFVYRLFVGSQP